MLCAAPLIFSALVALIALHADTARTRHTDTDEYVVQVVGPVGGAQWVESVHALSGLRSWKRASLGRPLEHELSSGLKTLRARSYTWDVNDRLRLVVDAMQGPIQYRHDALGNLAGARYPDGTVDLRLPDAVGNLFKREDRRDRKYGPAGQLLEAHGPKGVTFYSYDPEGNLIEKVLPTA